MATEIKVPELGENIESAEVTEVRVKAGDSVSEGQSLLVVNAEKATVEIPAPLAGHISQVLVKEGDSITVGQTVCLVEEGKAAQPARVKETAAAKPAVAAQAATAQAAMKSQELRPAPDELRPKPNGRRSETEKTSSTPPVPLPAGADGSQTSEAKLVPAGPATRRLARELGVDLGRVHGTAPGGRVTQDDIKTYVRSLADGAQAAASGTPQAPRLPDFERWGPVERLPLDATRKATARQMSLAWSLIPHVTHHDQADITTLEAFRKSQEGKGPKLTVTAFALKAVAIALREFPRFNSSLDLASGQLLLKRYYHVGVAVDTDAGLLVPVLRDVDRKDVALLAQELAGLAEKARQKQLVLEEMRGGTFTITNLGGIGGTGFSPIINYPEVAILGLARSRSQPVVYEGQVVPRLLLPLSLSYDHRVLDGAQAARFTRRIAELLDNPLLMLLTP
jgi:pyruvate dehydrogenase E2 component (dihydrolipoamide acetyltransferase)